MSTSNSLEQIVFTKDKPFSFKARLKSFSYAWCGLKALIRLEHNAFIHLAFTVAVFCLSILFQISSTEAMALIIVSALVWMAELINTAIEKSIDFVSTEVHPQIKRVKDLAAAAVLVAAVAAVAVGAIIFLPKIILYVEKI